MGSCYDVSCRNQGTTANVATSIQQRNLVWVVVNGGGGTTNDSAIQLWQGGSYMWGT